MANINILGTGNGTIRLLKTTAETPTGFSRHPGVSYWFTMTAHGLQAGDLVTFTQNGTLPAGLQEGVFYSIFYVVDANNVQITLNGYERVDTSDTGVGSNEYTAYKTSIELPNYWILRDEPEDRGFWQESVINNHREWNEQGQHWVIELKSFIYKNSGTARADFKAIKGYKGIDVYLHKSINDLSSVHLFRDSTGAPVEFVMTQFKPSYVTQAGFEDVLFLRLESKDPVELSEMT